MAGSDWCGDGMRTSTLPIPQAIINKLQRDRAKEIQAQEELKEKRERYVGTFDTNLRCACKDANVMDHATEHHPDLFKPEYRRGLTSEDILELFCVYHSYWCDTCGVIYKQSVIEGARGYIPREKATSV